MKNANRFVAALGAAVATTLLLSACFPFSLLGEPKQTKASGDAPATAQEFYAQTATWKTCAAEIECADVYAPLDWQNVGSEGAISLRLTRHVATGADRLGSLFVNPGGPGASGAEFVAQSVDRASSKALQESYDIIGWDPRGVGDSTAIECYDPAGMDEYIFGLPKNTPRTDAWITEMRESTANYGAACEEQSGELLANVDTINTAHDLDMLRSVVGDNKLNYIGYSYGTLIGAYYAELYPKRVGRVVLDGVVDPTATMFDTVLFQTKGFEQSLRNYLAWCLDQNDCPFTSTVDDAAKSIAQLLAKVEANPLRGEDGRMLGTGTLITAIIYPLYDEGSWPYLNQLFSQLRSGETQMAFTLADSYYSRDTDGTYLDNSNEAFAAINCLDYARETDVNVMMKNAALIEAEAPIFGKYQGYGELACADWPVPAKTMRQEITAKGSAPILVIGTTQDPATPYQNAVNLSKTLDNGYLVTYNGEGHTAYMRGSECVDAVVDDYLLTGKVPSADPQC